MFSAQQEYNAANKTRENVNVTQRKSRFHVSINTIRKNSLWQTLSPLWKTMCGSSRNPHKTCYYGYTYYRKSICRAPAEQPRLSRHVNEKLPFRYATRSILVIKICTTTFYSSLNLFYYWNARRQISTFGIYRKRK